MDIHHFTLTLKNDSKKEFIHYTASAEGTVREWSDIAIKTDDDVKKWFMRICNMICPKCITLSISNTTDEFLKLVSDFDEMHKIWKEDEQRREDIDDDYEKDDDIPNSVYMWYFRNYVYQFIAEINQTSNMLKIAKKLEGEECCVLNVPLTEKNTFIFKHCEHFICEEALIGMRKAKNNTPYLQTTIVCPMCRHTHTLDEILPIRSQIFID